MPASTRTRADAVVEGKGAGGDEGGDLAEGVAGEGDRRRDPRPGRLPDDQRGQEDRQLGFPGTGEIVGRLGQEQGGQRLAEGRLGPFDDAPGGGGKPRRPPGGTPWSPAPKDDRDTHPLRR